VLQNRGANFSLERGHPNALAPRKRPYHTILPGMTLYPETGALHASFTVMGGFMQPQGHLQVVSNIVDWGDDPQAALDRPRFCVDRDDAVCVEEGYPDQERLCRELERMGHRVRSVSGWKRALFGRGQVVMRDPDTGVLCAGSDGRCDGAAWAY